MANKLEDQLRECEAALDAAKKDLETVTAEDAATVEAAEEALGAAGAALAAAHYARDAAFDAAAHALGVLKPEAPWGGRTTRDNRAEDFTDTWRAAVLAWAGLSPSEADEASARGNDLLLPAMRKLALVAIAEVPAARDAEAAAAECYKRKRAAEEQLQKTAARTRRAENAVESRQSHVDGVRTKLASRDARKLDRDTAEPGQKPKKADPRHVEARRRLANVYSLRATAHSGYLRYEQVPKFTWPPKEKTS